MKKNNNIFNLEKRLKSNLKTRISITKDVVIRFMMTGLILTAVSSHLKAESIIIANGSIRSQSTSAKWAAVNLSFDNSSGTGAEKVDANAVSEGSVAIGERAKALNKSSVAIGIGAEAQVFKGIAIGNNALAIDENNADLRKYGSIAIGADSYARYWSTAIGHYAFSRYSGVALGLYAKANQEQAISLGQNSFANRQAVALGSDVYATGESSIAIGNDDIVSIYSDKLSDTLISSVYDNLIADGQSNIFQYRKSFNDTYGGKNKIYSPTFAKGKGAIAIGSRTVAAGDGSTSIGTLSFALSDRSTTLGLRSFVSQNAVGGTAIGEEARVFASNSLAVGNKTEATSKGAMAYGYNAYAVGQGSIAIGANVAANAEFANTGTGLPKDSTNLINFYETLATNTSKKNFNENPLFYDTPDYSSLETFNKSMTDFVKLFEKDSVGLPIRENTDVEITTDKDIKKKIATGGNAIAIGNNTYAVKQNSLALGYGTLADSENSFALGSYTYVKSGSNNSVALGVGSMIKGKNSFVIGTSSNTESDNTIILGSGSRLTESAQGSAAIGIGVRVGATNSFVAGNKSSSNASDTIVLGSSSNINSYGKSSIVLGNNSSVNSNEKNKLFNTIIIGNNSKVDTTSLDKQGNGGNVAILGNNSTATLTNSVVLGNNSTTNYMFVPGRNDSSSNGTVSGQTLDPYRPTNSSYGIKPDTEAGVVSVGGWVKSGSTDLGQRRIINVAAGALDSDAATVGQLRSLESARKDDNLVYIVESNGKKSVVKQVGDKYYHVDPITGFALSQGTTQKEVTTEEMKTLKVAPRGINASNFSLLGTEVVMDNLSKGKIEDGSKQAVTGSQINDLITKIIGTTGKITSDRLGFDYPGFVNLKQTYGTTEASTGDTFRTATDKIIEVMNKGIKLNSDANVEKTIYLGDTISILSENWGSGSDRYSKDNIATLTNTSNNIYIGIKENPIFKTVKLSQAQSNPADLDLITRKYLDEKGLKFVTDKLDSNSNEYKTNTTNNTVTILGGGSNGLQSINDTSGKKFETKNIRTYLNTDGKIYVTLADKPEFDSVTITKDQTAVDKTPIDQELISKKYLDKQLQNVSGTLKYSDGTVTNKSIDLKNGTLTIKGTAGKVTTTAKDNGEIVIGLDSSIADKTYVDNKVDGLSTTLNFKGDNTNATGSVNLKTNSLDIKGTTGEIETTASSNNLTIKLSDTIKTTINNKANNSLNNITDAGKNVIKSLVTVSKDASSSSALSVTSTDTTNGAKEYKISLNENTLLNNLKTDVISSTTPNTNEKLATGTAVKNYVDSKIQNISTSLTFTGNEGGDKNITLGKDKISIIGKSDEIKTTSKDGGILEIGLSDTIKTTINSKIDKDLTGLTETGGNVVKSKAMEAIDVKSTTDALQVSTDTNTANKKTFNLSLDTNKLKELAGVDKLDTIYAKVDASNITDPINKTKWRTALDVYTKGETNTEINKAKEVVEGTTNEIKVEMTPQTGTGNKYTVSLEKNIKDKIASIDNKADKTDLTELSNKVLGFVTDAKAANTTEISKKLGEKLEILGGIVNPTGTQRLVSFNDTDGKTYETKNIRTYTNNDGKLYITLAETPEFKTVKILKDQTAVNNTPDAKELISKEYLESRIDGGVEITNTTDAVSGNKIYDAIKGAKSVVNNGTDKYITVNGTKQDNINSDTYSIGFNKDKLVEDVRETTISGNGVDNKLTTSKAVVDYINSKITNITTSLKYDGDNNSEKTIDLSTGKLTLNGTTDEIKTTAEANGVIKIALDSKFKEKVDGKADKTYVDNTFLTKNEYTTQIDKLSADLNFKDDKDTKGTVNLKTGELKIKGTKDEIETSASNDTLTINLSKTFKDKVENKLDKNLSNLDETAKNIINSLVEVKSTDKSITVTSTTTNGVKTFDLKLDENKIKDLAGTTNLATEYAKIDASNITLEANQIKWREALKVYSKTETDTEIAKAKETVEGTAGEISIASDSTDKAKGIKYTVSLDKTLKGKIDTIDNKVDKSELTTLGNKTLTFVTNTKELNENDIAKKLGESISILGFSGTNVEFDNKVFETKNIKTYTKGGNIHIAMATNPEFSSVKITKDQTATAPEAKELISKEYLETRLDGKVENANTTDAVSGDKIYNAITGAKTKVDLKTGENILEITKSETIDLTANTYTLNLNTSKLVEAVRDTSINDTANDNKLATSKAVKDYVTGIIGNYSTNLTYTGDTGEKTIDLKAGKLNINGTKDEIVTKVDNDKLIISLDTKVKDEIASKSSKDFDNITDKAKEVITNLVNIDTGDKNSSALTVSEEVNNNTKVKTLKVKLDEETLVNNIKTDSIESKLTGKLATDTAVKNYVDNLQLSFKAGDNNIVSKKFNETLEVVGDTNISTAIDNGKLKISISNSPIFNSLTINNVPKNETDATNKKYVDDNLALKLDKSDIVNQMISYKVNGKDKKETKLSEGFDFSNGKNIEAEIGENGVVKFNLKDELTSINKISGGNNNKSNITFTDNDIVLENNNSKLVIAKDGTENTVKLTGLTDRNVDTQGYGEIGRAATENAVKDIALKLGLLKPEDVKPSVGPAGKDGQDGKSIVEKVEAIRDGLSGNVVYTTETGDRLVKENGKYYKVKEDGTKEEISEDKVVLSLVDAKGETTKSILLRNISSALGADTSTSPLDETRSKELVKNLLEMSGSDLNKAVNLSDLQALAQSGLDFITNNDKNIEHKTLGSSISIIGKDEKINDFSKYSSDNLATNIENGKIVIGMLERPTFKDVYLLNEKGDIEDKDYATGEKGNLAVRRSEVKDLIERGIKVKTEDNKEFTVKIGGTLEIIGEKNTSTTSGKVEINKPTTVSEETSVTTSGNVVSNVEDNKVVVRLTDNPEFDSVKIKDVEIKSNENKILFSGKEGKGVVLSNIEAGKEEKDAINVGQLREFGNTIVRYDDDKLNKITLGGKDSKVPVVISNLADGIKADDAVNKGQLDRLAGSTTSGIASAMAMSGIPQVIDRNKPYTIGAATAIYKGEGAVAVGVSGTNKTGNLIFKANSTINSKLDLGATVGIAYAFGDNYVSEEKGAISGELLGYINNMEKDLNDLKDYKEESKRKIAELEDKLSKLLDQKENENKSVLNSENYSDIMKCVIEANRCIVGDFETAKTNIINKGEIKELVRVLNENVESGVIDVIGHTDDRGKFDYNLDLGLQRAKEVVNLLKEYGLKKEIVFRNVTSSGKIVPIEGNKTTIQKAENRRVEIHFDHMKYIKK